MLVKIFHVNHAFRGFKVVVYKHTHARARTHIYLYEEKSKRISSYQENSQSRKFIKEKIVFSIHMRKMKTLSLLKAKEYESNHYINVMERLLMMIEEDE